MDMNKIKIIILIMIACFLIFWLGSIARCEILTYSHWKEFENLEKQNTMFVGQYSLKVLYYSDTSARVYYYNKEAGDVLIFIKKENQWIYDRWERTVWSKMGSADGFIWPYGR